MQSNAMPRKTKLNKTKKTTADCIFRSLFLSFDGNNARAGAVGGEGGSRMVTTRTANTNVRCKQNKLAHHALQLRSVRSDLQHYTPTKRARSPNTGFACAASRSTTTTTSRGGCGCGARALERLLLLLERGPLLRGHFDEPALDAEAFVGKVLAAVVSVQ